MNNGYSHGCGRSVSRRTVLQTLGVAGLGIALGTPASSRTTEGGWPAYRGNAANTGWVAGTDGIATAVEERWTVDPDLDVNYLSVRGGTVYVSMDNGESDPYEGAIRAVDAETGDQLWQYDTDRWTQSTPVVADDSVYALSNGDGDGRVFKLDASDGTEVWSRSLESESVSAVTAADGTVYVGEIADAVVAVDASDGARRWRSDIENRFWDPPAVVDGTVYVTGDNGSSTGDGTGPSTVHALDGATGEEQWQCDLGDARASVAPAVSAGTAYVGDYDGTLYAIATDDGSRRWTYESDDGIGSPPLVRDGTVYLDESESLTALDAADGSVTWTRSSDDWVSTPIGTTDAVYSNVAGSLTAVDPATGDTSELTQTDAIPVAVVGDSVYVNSRDSFGAFSITARASGLPVPTETPTPSPTATRTPTSTEPAPATKAGTTASAGADGFAARDNTETDPRTAETTAADGDLSLAALLGGALGIGALGAKWHNYRDADDGTE